MLVTPDCQIVYVVVEVPKTDSITGTNTVQERWAETKARKEACSSYGQSSLISMKAENLLRSKGREEKS